MDDPKFTATQESAHVKVENQDHADHFLRSKGFGASRVCASEPNSKPALLSVSSQPSQRPGSLQTSSLERQVRAAAVDQQAGRSARPPSLLARPRSLRLLALP